MDVGVEKVSRIYRIYGIRFGVEFGGRFLNQNLLNLQNFRNLFWEALPTEASASRRCADAAGTASRLREPPAEEFRFWVRVRGPSAEANGN